MAAAKRARTEEPYEGSRILHVGQLPCLDTLEPLRDVLEGGCLTLDASLNPEPDSSFFGGTYGHVDIEFSTAEAARAAFETLSGRVADGKALTVQLGSPLPTTAALRKILDEEPHDDFIFVIGTGSKDGTQQAYVVHQDDVESRDPEHVKKLILGERKDSYFVGELDARLRACLAGLKWADLLVVDLRE